MTDRCDVCRKQCTGDEFHSKRFGRKWVSCNECREKKAYPWGVVLNAINHQLAQDKVIPQWVFDLTTYERGEYMSVMMATHLMENGDDS